MTRRSFPSIDPSDLRRHDDEERVDRIWQRVERDLASRGDARAARTPFVLAVAAAATLAVFGGGVLVGKSAVDRRSIDPVTAAPAPDKSLVEVLAAGTQASSFPLEGGGRLTLSPGATVEVERAGSDMTLSLVQGEASLVSATRGLTIAAGEARINTQAGSVLTVRRNAEDVDVKVDEGTVNVSSPDGQGVVGRSEHKVLPIHVAVAMPTLDAKARDRALPRSRQVKPRGPAANTSPVAEWYTLYLSSQATRDDRVAAEKLTALALASLSKLDVTSAIDGAHGPKELLAIAELMGGKPAEIRALERLVTGFPADQRASLAADRLARIYEGRGDAARAKEYRDKVHPLAEKATAGRDALICDLINREPDKTKAALSAKEYLATYPDGECREQFERLVQSSAQPTAPAPPPAPSGSASAAPPNEAP